MSDDKKDKKAKEPKEAKPAKEAKVHAGSPEALAAEKKAAKGKGKKDEKAAGPAVSTQSEAARAKGIHLAEGEKYVPRSRKRYGEVVRKQLTEKFGYKNPMQVPKLAKIVINMGVGETTADTKKIQSAVRDLTLIAGQKPIVTKARK